jgi:hypothetical protein
MGADRIRSDAAAVIFGMIALLVFFWMAAKSQ